MNVLKLFLLAALTAAPLLSRAQATFLQDLNGQVIFSSKYTDVQGSPYFSDAWTVGSVVSLSNKTYAGLKVRFDAYAGELEYEEKGKPYRLAANQIRGFSMLAGGDTLRFTALPGSGPNPFFQVLYDGATQLLKQTRISLTEVQLYNSASPTKEFSRSEQYFVRKADGSLHKLTRSRKALVALFPEQKEAVEKATRGVDLTDEAALVDVFARLNP